MFTFHREYLEMTSWWILLPPTINTWKGFVLGSRWIPTLTSRSIWRCHGCKAQSRLWSILYEKCFLVICRWFYAEFPLQFFSEFSNTRDSRIVKHIFDFSRFWVHPIYESAIIRVFVIRRTFDYSNFWTTWTPEILEYSSFSDTRVLSVIFYLGNTT